MASNRTVVALVAALIAPVAAGWPVDAYLDLAPGADTFIRFAAAEWVEAEDPAVASAERLESGELLFTGVAPGSTLVMAYGGGRFFVWRVRVGGVASAGDSRWERAVRTACPGAELEERLVVTVATDGCRRALLALFSSEQAGRRRYRADDVALTFEIPVLQAQLQDLEAALAAAGLSTVRTRYLGAGLVLEGTVDPAGHRRALWQIFHRSAGRAPLDDRLVVAAPDAGGGG